MIDGNVYNGLISSLDIAPTIVSLAGGDFLENEFDGYDIIPHLLNNLPSPHDALFLERGRRIMLGGTNGKI